MIFTCEQKFFNFTLTCNHKNKRFKPLGWLFRQYQSRILKSHGKSVQKELGKSFRRIYVMYYQPITVGTTENFIPSLKQTPSPVM